jgi:hypothetical protein
MPEEIPPAGGNISQVVRVGETVRRTPGPSTAPIHALLRHLDTVCFEGVPRALGFDDDGSETLSHVEGVSGLCGREQ